MCLDFDDLLECALCVTCCALCCSCCKDKPPTNTTIIHQAPPVFQQPVSGGGYPGGAQPVYPYPTQGPYPPQQGPYPPQQGPYPPQQGPYIQRY